MNSKITIIFCLAYLLGLSLASFQTGLSEQGFLIIVIEIIILTIVSAIVVPRFIFLKHGISLWIIVATIAILGALYFQIRIPHPGINDLSHLLNRNYQNALVSVEGKIATQPKQTRSQRIQFWLEVDRVSQIKSFNNNKINAQTKTGKLYVTADLSEANHLHISQILSITGNLYKPKKADNPGAFDFQKYLHSQGAFAALKAKKIIVTQDNQDLAYQLWKLRQKIVKAQVNSLGDRAGSLVASMVLGGKAVDLPFEIRDRFSKCGLAHVFAASGFQISLLLGVTLALTKNLSKKLQIIIGTITLVFYIALTGIQASILRAGLMGFAVLVGLVMERKIKPLGSLLLAAIILLLFNPLWIENLGFQLSFLATLGLIVTALALQKKLDWLPPTIASLIAVPIAASLWTLPLLAHSFNTIATYSIPVNIITTPFISIISLVGMLSAVAALILPSLGSAIASALLYPTALLINIVDFFTTLPGSSIAIGKISLLATVLIYLTIVLIWLNKWCHKHWQLLVVFCLSFIFIPIYYDRLTLFQVTVLAVKEEPIIVIQDRGKATLINSGNNHTFRYTVLPFLTDRGINKIDYAVGLETQSSLNSNWSVVAENMPIKHFLTNLPKDRIQANLKVEKIQTMLLDHPILDNSIEIKLINHHPLLLQLKIERQSWLLFLDRSSVNNQIETIKIERPVKVIFWSGKSPDRKLLQIIQPQVAIVNSDRIAQDTFDRIRSQQIKLYLTNRDGAIQWTPKDKFQPTATYSNLEE